MQRKEEEKALLLCVPPRCVSAVPLIAPQLNGNGLDHENVRTVRFPAGRLAVKRVQHRTNTRVHPRLQGSCRHVASLLQACLKLSSSLCPPFPGRVTAADPPPSGKASRSARD